MDSTNLETLRALSAQLNGLFAQLIKDIEQLLDVAGRNRLDVFNEQILFERINKLIQDAIDEAFDLLGISIESNVQKHGERQIALIIAALGGGVIAQQFKAQLDARLAYMTDKLRSSYIYKKSLIDGKTIEKRIKTIKSGSEKVVRSIIRQSIEDADDAWTLSRKLERYLAPTKKNTVIAPWSILRRELGLPVSFVPKDVPAGSVKYNALRIARTEIAEATRSSMIAMVKDIPFVQGLKWNTSRAHPTPDVCDVLASKDQGLGPGVYPKGSYPQVPHPNCLCYPTAVVAKDALDALKARQQELTSTSVSDKFKDSFDNSFAES